MLAGVTMLKLPAADFKINRLSPKHFDNKTTLFQKKMNGKFLLLQWMIGFNLAFTMAMLEGF